MKGNYYVYLHINKTNGKKYVGITCQNPLKRWGSNGCNYLQKRRGRYIHPKFAKAILKYGWNNFEHKVWEVSSEKDVLYGEKYLISFYNTVKEGYNTTNGGEHFTFSDDSIQRMKQSQREVWRGNTERREKVAALFSSLPRTEEWIRKIREANASKYSTIQQMKDGTVIAEYISQMDAIRALGKKSTSGLSNCLNNKRKTYLGYEWRYKTK